MFAITPGQHCAFLLYELANEKRSYLEVIQEIRQMIKTHPVHLEGLARRSELEKYQYEFQKMYPDLKKWQDDIVKTHFKTKYSIYPDD